jgi:hypothetical protein
VSLGRENAETDADGHFLMSMEIPKRPSDSVQYIRATLRRNTGSPHFTQTAYDTWNKIVETVFLALLATVFGTILAIPLSFIAARNLMKTVKSPLTSIALSVLGWPIGIVIGFVVVRWVGGFSSTIGSNAWVNIASILISPALMWFGVRWACTAGGDQPSKPVCAICAAGCTLHGNSGRLLWIIPTGKPGNECWKGYRNSSGLLWFHGIFPLSGGRYCCHHYARPRSFGSGRRA